MKRNAKASVHNEAGKTMTGLQHHKFEKHCYIPSFYTCVSTDENFCKNCFEIAFKIYPHHLGHVQTFL